MREKTLHLLFFIILTFIQPNGAAEKRSYRYLEKTGTTTIEIERTIEVFPDGITLTYDEGGAADSVIECGADYEHAAWRYRRLADKTDFTMERSGRSIAVKGGLNGKPVEKNWKLDEDPWYQTLEFALIPWLQKGEKDIRFWSARPTDLGLFKMTATREAEETITIEGESVEAIRVRVSPAGLLSVFWKAEYWFRKSDLCFMKYRAVRGVAGTPETIVTLTAEK